MSWGCTSSTRGIYGPYPSPPEPVSCRKKGSQPSVGPPRRCDHGPRLSTHGPSGAEAKQKEDPTTRSRHTGPHGRRRTGRHSGTVWVEREY